MNVNNSFSEQEHFIHNTTSFSKHNLKKLKDSMHDQFLSKDSTLFWEGDDQNNLYFLKEGVIRLTKMTDEGKDLSFYYFRSGDMFGEFGYSDTSTCTFSAKTITKCKIGVLPKEELEITLWQYGDLAIDYMKWMGHMQRFTQLKLRDLLFYGKNAALASTLIRITNTFGICNGNAIYITEKFTNSELASLIGSTRETVNRMISQLKKEKVIAFNQGLLVILDLEYLKGICHCEGCPKNICRL